MAANEYDALVAADPAPPSSNDTVYDDLVRQNKETEDNALKASIRQAVPVNPDTAAKQKNLSLATGVPVDVIARNEEAVAANARAVELRGVLARNPILARQMTDPEFAKIAHDDAENLGLFETVLKTYLGASVKSGVESLLGTGAKLLDAAGQIAGVATSEQDVAGRMKGRPEHLKEFLEESPGMFLPRFARAMQQASEATMANVDSRVQAEYGDLKYATLDPHEAAYLRPLKVVGDVIQSLPTALGLAATVYFTKGVAARVEAEALAAGMAPELARKAAIHAASETAAKLSASTEGAAGYGQQQMQTREQAARVKDEVIKHSPEYQQLIEAGYSHEAARTALEAVAAETAGIGGGVIDAITNFFGGKILGRIIGEGGSLAKRTGKGFATEAVTEGVQSGGEQLAQNAAIRQFVDGNQGLFDGVVEQIAQGFVVGGVMGASFTAAFGRKRDAETAEQHAEALKKLFEIAGADKLRERTPAEFARFVQEAADETGTNAVYIDAAVFAQAAQEKGLDVGAAMPETAKQLEEAIATRGDVRIPLGELTTALPGTGLENTLLQHMRTSPDAPTLAEVQDKRFIEETQTAVAKAMAGQEFNDAHRASAGVVENELLAQLTTANRFTKDVNSAYAKMMSTFYLVQAARLGITPEEMYVKYPLRVQAETGAGENVMKEKQQAMTQPRTYSREEIDALDYDGQQAFVAEHGVLPSWLPEKMTGPAAEYIRDNGEFAMGTREQAEKYAKSLMLGEGGTWGVQQVQGQWRAKRGGNAGTSDAGSANILEQPPFYSALSMQIASLKMNSGTAEAWKNAIKGLVSKGVKQAEIEATGINDWLDTREGKLSKEDVTKFLQTNGLRVGEKILGGEGQSFEVTSFGEWGEEEPDAEFIREQARDLYLDNIKADLAADQGIPVEEVDEKEAMANAIARAEHYDDPERGQRREIEVSVGSSDYTFIQTSDHGDIDLFLPSNQPGLPKELQGGDLIEVLPRRHGRAPDDAQVEAAIRRWLGDKLGVDFDTGGAPFADYTLPGGENYQVLLLTLPDAPEVPYTVKQEADGTWVAIDPTRNNTNELRASNREAAEQEAAQIMPGRMGKGATFRSSHFDEPNIAVHIRTTEREDIAGKKVLFVEEIQSDWAQSGKREGFQDNNLKAALQAELDNEATTDERRNEIFGALTDNGHGVPSAPFVTKTEAWVGLAVKRIITYAEANGFERVAWTTGEQQADRYSLRKRVDSIEWKPVAEMENVEGSGGGGAQRVHVRLRGGTTLSMIVDKNGVVKSTNRQQGELENKKLESVIGKTAAEKIMSSAEGELKEKGLEIGGEGMLTFYDKIVPNVVNDVLKKLGGVRVETVQMPDDGGLEQPGFTITREMKDILATTGYALPMFQQNRGQISFGENIQKEASVITLLKNADLSTFLHESGHFYLEVMADIASQPDAPVEIQADMQHILDWFGVLNLAKWSEMSLEEKRPYHERFARGFESYLFTGKAPSQELNGLFSRFRAWMLNVYRQITALNVTLTPEVTQVFDRMLASNDAILEAEAARAYTPLFKTAAEMGATAEEWKAYQELGLEATQDAISMLESRGLRDMKWLSNAKSRMLKKLQKEADAKRKAVTKEVAREVRSQPVYAALRFLTHGELADENRSNEDRRTLDDFAGKPHKLSIPSLKEMYGDHPAAPWRYLNTGKFGHLAAEDGLSPNMVAELFGFTSGDHLVREILQAEPEAAVIEGMTDQRMLERYGDLASPEALEAAAHEEIHSEARAKFLVTELRALTKATGQRNIIAKAAKEFAATLIDRKKIREIRPAQYEAAEARAGRNAERAKTLIEKATEKRNQIVNHYAAKAALDAREYVEKNAAYLRRVGDSKSVDPEYREQIQALLARYELRAVTLKDTLRRENLAQWAEDQVKQGFEPVIDAELLDETKRMPYREMPLEDFRGLVDAVKNIEHLGRLKHRLIQAKDQREFKLVVDEAAQSITDHAKRTIKAPLEHNTWTDKMKGGVAQFFAWHRKFSSMIRELDGYNDDGVLTRLFLHGLNAAGDAESNMRETATKALAALVKPVLNEGRMSEKRYIPEIKASLSREGRIMVALNMGTEGNLQRLLDGDNWTLDQAAAVLNTLTKNEMAFVQAIWDFVGGYKNEIGTQQKRITGVAPEWVEPRVVQTVHGDYAGGYIPAKYDTTRSTRSLSDEAAVSLMDQWRAKRGSAKTRDSFTKARAKKVVDRPLRKDFGVITQHVTEVTHRLAWQEYLIDSQRLLRAPKIDEAIREHYGPEVLEAMRNTMEDIAKGEVGAQNAFEQGINYLRTGATIAGLGWRITTSLLQPIGLTQSMVRIGPKYVGRGLAQWIGSSLQMENTAGKISQKSDFMRLRAKTMQREISEIRNVVAGKNSAVEASYFYLIQKLQLVADIPTWLGQYEKAVEHGADEKTAVAQADQAVIDAQGSGMIKDLAAAQRGGPLQKLFTNFYSFFNTTYNLTSEVIGRTKGTPLSIGKAAVDLLLLYSVPAALGTLMKAALHSGDSGADDEKKLYRQLIADQLTYLFGTMVGLREISGAVQTAAGLPGDYQGPASVRVFAELAKLGKQAGQGEADEAFWKAMNNVTGILFHYPSGQVGATVDGIVTMADGKTNNPGALLVGSNR